MSEARSTEQPGRYQRSAGGLVGALLILLVLIAAFVAFRALTRSALEVRPEPVDYLATVGDAQAAGLEVVYPTALPEGWIATAVHLRPAVEQSWGISMLTEDDSFVGLRQDDEDLDELLGTYVDQNAAEVEAVDIDSEVATRWRVFTDDGGDTAYAAEAGPDDSWVLVYGSAEPAELVRVVASLTRAPR